MQRWGTPHVFFAAGFLGLLFCLPVYPLFLFGQLLRFLCPLVCWFVGLGLASGLGCRVVALVWFGRAILFYLMCLGAFVSLYMLMVLVLLRMLVWSMSYVLWKKLICSNSVLLGMSLMVRPWTFWCARIVLKCEKWSKVNEMLIRVKIIKKLKNTSFNLLKCKIIHYLSIAIEDNDIASVLSR